MVVARVVEAEAELSGGLEGPAPGRRPIFGFGLKESPPVFFSIELMIAVLVGCPRLRLYWDQMRGWHGLWAAWWGNCRDCVEQGSTDAVKADGKWIYRKRTHGDIYPCSSRGSGVVGM